MSDFTKWEELEREAIEKMASPGFRFFAHAATDAPIAKVEGGRFVDTWPMAWLPLSEVPPGTALLRLTSFQAATGGSHLLHVVGRTQAWTKIRIPAGSVAIMLGWESGRSDVRIVGQGVIEMAYFDSLTKALYGR